MRLRTRLDIEDEVKDSVADGELTNEELINIAKTALVKKLESSKFRLVRLDRAACKEAGLRYSKNKGGCYSKCRNARDMLFDA